MSKERYCALPNVTIPETEYDFKKEVESYCLDTKSVTHFERNKNVFTITYYNGDIYQNIYSDWKNSSILALLFELKLLCLMNYWNKLNG